MNSIIIFPLQNSTTYCSAAVTHTCDSNLTVTAKTYKLASCGNFFVDIYGDVRCDLGSVFVDECGFHYYILDQDSIQDFYKRNYMYKHIKDTDRSIITQLIKAAVDEYNIYNIDDHYCDDYCYDYGGKCDSDGDGDDDDDDDRDYHSDGDGDDYDNRYAIYNYSTKKDECIVGKGGGICPCCGGIGDSDGRNAIRRSIFSNP
jgi:hypothetical protein